MGRNESFSVGVGSNPTPRPAPIRGAGNRRIDAVVACLTAFALTGCAAPEFKTFYLSAHDWRGSELSGHGQLRVADATAGAAPRTVTVLEIGGLLDAPRDPERRLRLQVARGLALTAALERHGVALAAIGVEVLAATGSAREPPPALLTKPMVVIVHY